MSSSRQLAAIMFTDIVGYTALMGKDEQNAFELLKESRDIHKPLIKKYHGTWIKELGDGVLASFTTVTDAVFCAASIHQAANQVEGLQFRIGIHLGEVIFENNDVFGDGVNIASRLQAIASIGSTWVSEAVYKNLVNKKEITSESIKEERLKNVSEPIKVYEISVKEIPGDSPDKVQTHTRPRSEKPLVIKKNYLVYSLLILSIIAVAYFLVFNKNSIAASAAKADNEKSIAIIPFKNMSANKEQNQSFCDGVMESILNHLIKMKGLHVIDRTSVEQYRDTKKTMAEIANELRVAYIVEGGVQREDGKIKITARVIHAADGNYLWSDEYPGDEKDLFGLQTAIAEEIASSMKVTLSPKEQQQIARIPTKNMDAWNIYLQAQSQYVDWVYSKAGDEGYDRIMERCNQALALDPRLADAYVLKAQLYWDAKYGEQMYNKEFLDSVKKWCDKALEVNPGSSMALILLGDYYLNNGKADLAKEYFDKATDIAPNEMYSYWGLAHYYKTLGKNEDEFANLQKALVLAPQSVWLPQLYRDLSTVYFNLDDLDKGFEFWERAAKLEPSLNKTDHTWYYIIKGDRAKARKEALKDFKYDSAEAYERLALYCSFFEPDSALFYFERYFKLKPAVDSIPGLMHRYAYAVWMSGRKEQGLKEFEKAEAANLKLTELGRNLSGLAYDLAGINSFLGRKEKALDYLRSYPGNSWPTGLPYAIDFDPLFNNLRGDPEFQKIVADAKAVKAKLREQIRRLETE